MFPLGHSKARVANKHARPLKIIKNRVCNGNIRDRQSHTESKFGLFKFCIIKHDKNMNMFSNAFTSAPRFPDQPYNSIAIFVVIHQRPSLQNTPS